VGGAVLSFEVLLGLAVCRVGVGDLDQVPAGLREVGGVEPGGGVEEEHLAPLPDPGVGGELVDGVHDHRGLFG